MGRAAVERLAAWPFTLWTTTAGVLVLLVAVAGSTISDIVTV